MILAFNSKLKLMGLVFRKVQPAASMRFPFRDSTKTLLSPYKVLETHISPGGTQLEMYEVMLGQLGMSHG